MTEYKIKDLKKGTDDVDITITIDFVAQKDTRTLYYGDERYIRCYVVDDTGEIGMTFWGDQIKKVKEGAKVRITEGYVTEFKGMLQLNTKMENPPEFIK
ncbi:MAG: hypothetical protein KAS15_02310 [Nanoarchaeota archaeon]|nr:hypothetical protein [Nanoarchaeota archaeon]MCK5630088.1 hypothetical protein [Nanoarchaeota archaeon]